MVEASLYEHLFPLTTIMKQRVVEHFSGDTLCTVRWTTLIGAGSANFTMNNAINGGFEINPTASSSSGSVHFCCTRQYSCAGAVIIGVVSRDAAAINQIALHEFNTANTNHSQILMTNDACGTNYTLTTNDTTAPANTVCTAVATDGTRRNVKIQLNACDAELTLCGGSVDATSSCDLPNTKMQPMFRGVSRTGNVNIFFHYLEAYNT